MKDLPPVEWEIHKFLPQHGHKWVIERYFDNETEARNVYAMYRKLELCEAKLIKVTSVREQVTE